MIRIFQHGDHTAVAEIFTRAIHEIACEVYTQEQCLAWSDRSPNPAHWKKRCELKRPFIFEKDGKIAGFLELDSSGHIDCAYVHPKYQRQGVITALVKHAVTTCFEMGVNRVSVDASLCSRNLFEKLGFQVIQENIARIRGAELLNFQMELSKPART